MTNKITHTTLLTDDLRAKLCAIDELYFSYPWKKAQWDEVGVTSDHYFMGILWNQDQIIGFSLYLLNSLESLAHLLKVVVIPSWRGKNLGFELLKADIVQLIRIDLNKLYLEVAENNKTAINCYRRLGLEQIHRSRNFYSDGADALIMIGDINAMS